MELELWVLSRTDGAEELVREARWLQDQAAALARTSAGKLRDAVDHLRHARLTGADIALALGVSPQRVSQLSQPPVGGAGDCSRHEGA